MREGIKPGDLGSHSARKGICILAAVGTTVPPPTDSVYLCVMWSMGVVK